MNKIISPKGRQISKINLKIQLNISKFSYIQTGSLINFLIRNVLMSILAKSSMNTNLNLSLSVKSYRICDDLTRLLLSHKLLVFKPFGLEF